MVEYIEKSIHAVTYSGEDEIIKYRFVATKETDFYKAYSTVFQSMDRGYRAKRETRVPGIQLIRVDETVAGPGGGWMLGNIVDDKVIWYINFYVPKHMEREQILAPISWIAGDLVMRSKDSDIIPIDFGDKGT